MGYNKDYKQEYLQEWQRLYYPKQWKENVDKWYSHNLTYEKERGNTSCTFKIEIDNKGVMWCSIETSDTFTSIQVDVCFFRNFCDEVYYYRQQGLINSQEHYKEILEVCKKANSFLFKKESDVVSNVFGMDFIDKESDCNVKLKINHNTINNTKTYLIKNKRNGFYKIGKSKNPKYREKTLQSEEPDIIMVKIWDKDIERELHNNYDKYRLRGEWFKLNKIQVKYICKKDYGI